MTASSGEARKPPKPGSSKASTESLCVLLIEDHDASRTATSELLGDDGFTVITASTAAEALAAYDELASSIDVVVTDVGLPDMAIEDLIAELNRIRPIRATVYVSGLPEDDRRIQKLLEDRNATYLKKPVDIEILLRSIALAAKRHVSRRKSSRNSGS